MGFFDGMAGGALSLIGGMIANEATSDRQDDANRFNSQQSDIARQFNEGEAIKNRAFTAEEAEKARVFNSNEASINRMFQETMSNSAFQRGVADMKKAGINPMLAYSKGGASAPSGSAASGPSASGSQASSPTAHAAFAEARDVVTPAVQSALAARANAATVDNLEQQNQNLKTQQQQTLASTALTMAQQNNVNADTRVKEAILPRTVEEATKLRSENSARSADSDFYSSKFGTGIRYLGNTLSEINPLKGLFR